MICCFQLVTSPFLLTSVINSSLVVAAYKFWGFALILLVYSAGIVSIAGAQAFLIKKRSYASAKSAIGAQGSAARTSATYRASAGFAKPNPEFPLGSLVDASPKGLEPNKNTERDTVVTVGGMTVVDSDFLDEDDEVFAFVNPLGNPRAKFDPSRSDVAL